MILPTPPSRPVAPGVRHPAILLGASVGLAMLFMASNGWQLTRSWLLLRGILRAPPAVNLVVLRGEKEILRRSFPANDEGDWYLVGDLDLGPGPGPVPLSLRIDGRPLEARRVQLDDAVAFVGRWREKPIVFLFARPQAGMRRFARLQGEAPRIARALGGEGT